MDRMPPEILLEIVEQLATFPTPTALLSFLAACPSAAAALAARPRIHSLTRSVDMRIAALEREIDLDSATAPALAAAELAALEELQRRSGNTDRWPWSWHRYWRAKSAAGARCRRGRGA